MSEREYSERPWGNYTVLMTTHPTTRSSAWSCTPASDSATSATPSGRSTGSSSGHGEVKLDGNVTQVHPGEAIDIPLESAHRVANEGDTDVVLIEVQRGTYFGEDDIVRLEDDFGRVDGAARGRHHDPGNGAGSGRPP